MQILKIQSAG